MGIESHSTTSQIWVQTLLHIYKWFLVILGGRKNGMSSKRAPTSVSMYLEKIYGMGKSSIGEMGLYYKY